MRLFVATPTQDKWHPEYGHSLAWAMLTLLGKPDWGVEAIHHRYAMGTLLHQLRNDLVEEALQVGATHILWNDCDMQYKPEHVQSLMSRKLDIVGCNYIRRQPPHTSIAIGMDGKYLIPGKGIEEVVYTGMGLMLTSIKVFESIPAPWFEQPWAGDHHISEDVYFCKLAADNGFKVHVDHDASYGVGHVAKQILTIEPSMVN